MHDDRRIVEDRIRRFVDKRLNGAVYVDSAPLTVTAWAAPGEPVPFAEAVGQDFHEITPGRRGAPVVDHVAACDGDRSAVVARPGRGQPRNARGAGFHRRAGIQR